MNPIIPLPDCLLKPYVEGALQEDLGRRGDVTSIAMIDDTQTASLHIISRENGIMAGIDLARLTFLTIDPSIQFNANVKDGAIITSGMILAEVKGNARALLAAERTALNFMTHLSGIASEVAKIRKEIQEFHAEITCTRKTLPGLRILQKYAVRVGGGRNHRMGLDDAILIKDNHIAIAGGNITDAIKRTKAFAGHLIPIEVEVDTIEQLKLVLNAGVNLVLLDNMSPEILHEAVTLCRGRCQTEASGGISPEMVKEVAATGVDFIAMGWITHSAKSLDIGLDYLKI